MISIRTCARLGMLLAPMAALCLTGCTAAKPTGKSFVQLEGGEVEYLTAGEGRPSIVFLNGYGLDIDHNWGKVLPEAEKQGRVLAYNRFGDGGSDKARTAQTGMAVIATLRQLLQETKLPPPYLFVGHSIGGVYANLYARRYPEEVAGVVLVDSTHPEQDERWRGHKGLFQRALWGTMLRLSSKNAEIQFLGETAREVRESGPFPNVPLTVITAGIAPPRLMASREVTEIHHSNQRELAAMSPRGTQIVAEKSGHLVPLQQPEIVIQAIREMAEGLK